MQGYNLIVVYNVSKTQMLMCRRIKEPYKGLLNFVGGKINLSENGLSGAYRELYEESGITEGDIALTHLMDFTYYIDKCYVEVYVGKLNKEFTAFGDENDLLWVDFKHNFFSMSEFAGEGNIGHIMEHVNMNTDKLLK